MSNLMKRGSELLVAKQMAHASITVTYSRGEVSADVDAIPGATRFETEDETGIHVKSQMRDYLIPAASLVLDSVQTLPIEGDRIAEVDGSKRHIYEVLPLGGEPCWRYSDTYRDLLRIHTKLLMTEDV